MQEQKACQDRMSVVLCHRMGHCRALAQTSFPLPTLQGPAQCMARTSRHMSAVEALIVHLVDAKRVCHASMTGCFFAVTVCPHKAKSSPEGSQELLAKMRGLSRWNSVRNLPAMVNIQAGRGSSQFHVDGGVTAAAIEVAPTGRRFPACYAWSFA
jgi:hypothetical protein